MRCLSGNSHLISRELGNIQDMGARCGHLQGDVCGSAGKEQRSSDTEGKRILGTKRLHPHSGDKKQRE